MNAASLTERVIGPLCDRAAQKSGLGQYGTTPSDGLKPNTPHSAAGIRIDPAPSEPCASAPIPAAMDAALHRWRHRACGSDPTDCASEDRANYRRNPCAPD